MTRRERLEAKVERRREWADGRRDKANVVYAYTERYHGDTAFNTQPGHIPERARVIRMEDRARDDAAMAAHHEAKADGLERQLDQSIFSDDADAIEQLETRIAERTAEVGRIKALNVAIRREMKAGLTEGWLDRIDATGEDKKQILHNVQFGWRHEPVFSSYVLTNLNANIRRDKERIEEIRARAARAEQAATNGGVMIRRDGGWCQVTFAEKPDRSVLNTLKSAGFRWGRGYWLGRLDQLPASVAEKGGEADVRPAAEDTPRAEAAKGS